jgi:L-alanine-DL-glutamate epimerase-like enolase superfamily enzyme
MKITQVNTTRVAVPYREDIVSSFRGRQSGVDPVIVEIETDEGLSGWGEVIGAPPFNSMGQVLIDEVIAPVLLGEDPFRIDALTHRMDAVTTKWVPSGAFATSAIDFALHDIKGKALGVSVADLLGGRTRERVPVSGYVFIGDVEDNVRLVRGYKEMGVPGLKVKVGRDPRQDVERIAAIREALGPDLLIRIDADEAWSAKKAIQCIRELEQYQLALVEQPVPLYDLDGMALVRRSVDVPVAADDSIWSHEDVLRHATAGTCDAVVIRPEETGGLRKFLTVAETARAANLACACGSWGSSGLLLAARLQALAASSAFAYPADTHFYFLEDDVLPKGSLAVRDGAFDVPKGPGLGVEPDRDKIAELAERSVQSTRWTDPEYIPTAPRHVF